MSELPASNEDATQIAGTTVSSDEELKYIDPFRGDPGRKGMLLSNQIDWFCRNGVLIAQKDYKESNLRPASYTLTIGPQYVDSAGRMRTMDHRDRFFYMEPNSIVYVSTAESLNLPFYIAARFNLRVKWVYKGILLGTGPQVEPGFTGKLSCPLFNFTDRAIKIKLDDPFATIDFERTTDFGCGKSYQELKAATKIAEELDVVAVGDEKFLLFKQRPFPALKHLPDHDIVSSLVQLSDEVKQWRAIGIGVVIAFVSLALTLLNFQNNLYREQKATSQQVFQLERDLAIESARTDILRKAAVTDEKPEVPPGKSPPTSEKTPARSQHKQGQ
jgi:deoxycytidine triphosphate deaminase